MFEQHGARHTDFRAGEKLGARDHVVQWSRPARPNWMSREAYLGYPKQITVREAKVGKKVLATTLRSPRKTARADLEALFLRRRHV